MSNSGWNRYTGEPYDFKTDDNYKFLHYGDPPFSFHGEWCAGASMNCDDLRILEFWEYSNKTFEWERNKEFEIEFVERIIMPEER
jgi:hypothetical protein